MILGCIGNDFTGSSDLGLTLSAGGLRTVQYVGVPKTDAARDVEAGIVSLKSRSAPVRDAVSGALDALGWLRRQGCRRFLFKYCSTFDSTPAGNIGPVAEALAEALGHDGPLIFCPAFPETGRTVYQGHLFVGDRLLSESGLEAHPLTPMTDPDLRRWLARQSTRGVGHLPLGLLRKGPEAARAALAAEVVAGRPLVICDAIEESDLLTLAEAARDLPLMTGGSGIALGLPKILGARTGTSPDWPGQPGPAAAISGSCSAVTRLQIARHEDAGRPARRLSVQDIIGGLDPSKVAHWAMGHAAADRLPLVYTSAAPDEVAHAQQLFGSKAAASAVEAFLGALAAALIASGVTRLIVAGGETSGAVVTALGIDALAFGPGIAPGVPALRVPGRPLVLALKSGNFGSPDFLAEAARVLAGRAR
jgi:uncharacterized protein YgbK (DUF1537 family)